MSIDRPIATLRMPYAGEPVGVVPPRTPHLSAPYGNRSASVVHSGCKPREWAPKNGDLVCKHLDATRSPPGPVGSSSHTLVTDAFNC